MLFQKARAFDEPGSRQPAARSSGGLVEVLFQLYFLFNRNLPSSRPRGVNQELCPGTLASTKGLVISHYGPQIPWRTFSRSRSSLADTPN